MLHLITGLTLLATIHTAQPAYPLFRPAALAPVAAYGNVTLDAGRARRASAAEPTLPAGPTPTAGPDGGDVSNINNVDPMNVPTAIHWKTFGDGLKNIIRHFGLLIAGVLSGIFILMMLWAGVLYQINSGNPRQIDAVRTKVKHIMEGALIALGAGFFFAVITLIANTALTA